MCREPPLGHVFVGSLAEVDTRKVAEVVRRWPDKKQRLCDPFFRALSETHSAISLETCKTSSFQASTPPAEFHPNRSKFQRFISENDVPDRYNNRRSDRYRIADNKVADPVSYPGDLFPTLTHIVQFSAIQFRLYFNFTTLFAAMAVPPTR